MNKPRDDAALRHAQRLATILWERHWKAENPHWRVGKNLLMVIDQIDNAVAGLVRDGADIADQDAGLPTAEDVRGIIPLPSQQRDGE